MGIPGDLNNKKVIDAEKKVIESAKNHGIIAGIHSIDPNVKSAIGKIDLGYKFIAVGTDFLFLKDSCGNTINELRKRFKT